MVAAVNPLCPECGTTLVPGARFCHGCGWDSRNPAAGRARVEAAPWRPAWKRRTMAAITLVTVVVLATWLLWPGGTAATAVVPGQPAPDFVLSDLQGQTVQLSALRGKHVVINFWATWCPPCRAEMPALQAVAERYADRGLVVLAVNLGESPLAIRSFVERYQIRLRVLLDPNKQVAERYRIVPLPTTFFVGPDGLVRAKVEGQMDENRADAEARRLLGLP